MNLLILFSTHTHGHSLTVRPIAENGDIVVFGDIAENGDNTVLGDTNG